MNKSARILSYVVFVFAIAAVVLSLLLALRRDEFRGRADKMAKLLMDMAKIMDTNSSTNLAKDTWIKPADPLTKPPTPETGTLSWPRYHATKGEDKDPSKQYIEFDKTLTKSRELVKELQKQRDYLADRLVETALTIGLPEEQFKSDDLKKALKNLKDIKPGANRYEEASKIITDFATHVNTRDKAMIKSIVRVISTSTALPQAPRSDTQASPRPTPITNDTPITARPMNSEMRAPCIRRVSMSRPRLSVPSQKRDEPPADHIGGARTASRNCSVGE